MRRLRRARRRRLPGAPQTAHEAPRLAPVEALSLAQRAPAQRLAPAGDQLQQALARAPLRGEVLRALAHPAVEQREVVLLAEHFAEPVGAARDATHALGPPPAAVERLGGVAEVLDAFAPRVQRVGAPVPPPVATPARYAQAAASLSVEA